MDDFIKWLDENRAANVCEVFHDIVANLNQLRTTIAKQQARIAELEAACKQHEENGNTWLYYQARDVKNIAALQAMLKKKDEALSIAMIGGDYLPTEREELQRVLSLTSPTDALAPYLRCVEALEVLLKGSKMDANEWYWAKTNAKAALAAVKGEK